MKNNFGIKAALVLFITLVFSSCFLQPDFPNSFDKTRWTAQEIDMSFDVKEDQEATGVWRIGTKEIYILVDFTYSGEILCYPSEDNDKTVLANLPLDENGLLLFCSMVDISSESFRLINFDEREQTLLPDDVTEVTFIREDIE